jgi:integrase
MSSSQPLLDAAGRRRSPATTPGFRTGIAPRNKGQRYPADPPTVDEIVAVMRQAGHDRHGHRQSALIVVLWRAGLRIHEALSLTETDLDTRRGSVLVRHGKNDRRREVGMDAWAWSAIQPWLADRMQLPVGALFCVIDGPTRGRAWSDSAARVELRQLALKAGVRRRFAPHQLRHAHAVKLMHEGDRAAADPAPARPLTPVNDRHLPRGDQQRGDHLHRPRKTRANDARQRRPRPLADNRGSAAALPHRPLLSNRAAMTHGRRW